MRKRTAIPFGGIGLLLLLGVLGPLPGCSGSRNIPKEDALVVVEARRRNFGTEAAERYSPWAPFETRTVEGLAGFRSRAVATGRYGGRTDRRVTATGFYRAERIGERWWAVDPEGHPYLHVAVNSVTPGGSLRNERAFVAKFGDARTWIAETARLLNAHGFNGTGSWSDTERILEYNAGARAPLAYTVNWNFMSSYGKVRGGTFQEPGHTGYPNGVMFVFDPAFETFAREHAKELVRLRDDPNLFGHFSDNELPFNLRNLEGYLTLPDTTDPGYLAARQWLADRGLTRAQITDEVREQFMAYAGERYFRIVSEAIRAVDPNHMYLGPRLYGGQMNTEAFMRAVGPYVDVMAANYYGQWTPRPEHMDNWTRWTGKPFIITEFYVKGEDSGLPNQSGAGWIVRTQRDRGLFYQNYTLALLESGNCVGWHHFRFQDNDPENTRVDPSNNDANKGIVDNLYNPHTGMLDLMKALNTRVYTLADYFDAR